MKKVILVGYGICLMLYGFSQKTAVAKPTADKSDKKIKAAPSSTSENTLLWEVSGNGLQNASYLFGTMHILCVEDSRLSDNLKIVIKETGQIYFEIDMDNMMEMLGAMKYLQMNDGKKLKDLLTAEDYKKITDYFAKNPAPIPLQMMEGFKPYFISSLISEQKMDCDKGGMEQVIMDESKQYKKEIKGLETVEFQASVFDSIPYDQQARELVKTIDSAATNSQVTDELIAVYKKQDLKKIEELTMKEEGGVAEFIDLLLYNRNADWADKMKTIMKADRTLFAVGAAHLPGEKGLISLLRKKGYILKPVAN
ncbi:MAG: TraB/GumN family protein [Chitinophagaceae bacterium]